MLSWNKQSQSSFLENEFSDIFDLFSTISEILWPLFCDLLLKNNAVMYIVKLHVNVTGEAVQRKMQLLMNHLDKKNILKVKTRGDL